MIKRIYVIINLFFVSIVSCTEPQMLLSPSKSVAGVYSGEYLNIAGSLIPLPLITGNATFDLKILVKERFKDIVDISLELIEKEGEKTKIDREETFYVQVVSIEPGVFHLQTDSTLIGIIKQNQLEFMLEFEGMSTQIIATKDI